MYSLHTVFSRLENNTLTFLASYFFFRTLDSLYVPQFWFPVNIQLRWCLGYFIIRAFNAIFSTLSYISLYNFILPWCRVSIGNRVFPTFCSNWVNFVAPLESVRTNWFYCVGFWAFCSTHLKYLFFRHWHFIEEGVLTFFPTTLAGWGKYLTGLLLATN